MRAIRIQVLGLPGITASGTLVQSRSPAEISQPLIPMQGSFDRFQAERPT